MSDFPPDSGPPPVAANLVRAELEKVLSSGRFAAAERQRRFLQFVVGESLEGRQGGIKESVVAVEVFGRDGTFDPRIDSVVRSEARNLRGRLSEYYQGEGRADPIVIEIPKGSYIPVFRVADRPAERPFRPFRASRAAVVAAAAGLAVCLLAVWYLAVRPGRLAGRDRRSVVVLPFLNLAGRAEGEVAADGFVEDLTTGLAKLEQLRVVARTSAFQYRGKSQDIRKIGRELDAGAVLEGGFREETGRVKVTVQLIDAASGYHLWSESYDRESDSVQSVEAEIVNGVSLALGVRPKDHPAPRHTPSAESRDAYWRGRYLKANNWQRAGEESIPYFEQAVAADPQYAEAWAALAATRGNMAFQLQGNQQEQIAKAREAARRAFELDPSIAETQLALAGMAYSYDRNWPAAERAFRRALELNPSYAAGHRGFALGLLSRGRFAEAIEHLRLAEQLDPISILTTNNRATTLYCARRYDEAIRVARRHVELDPQFFPARHTMALCKLQKGNRAEATAELEKIKTETGGGYISLFGYLGYGYARMGRQADAEAALRHLEGLENPTAVARAMVHTGLGDRRKAVECLQEAADTHIPDAIFMGVDPVFDSLHGDPGFQALCARLGLPPVTRF